MGKLSNGSGNTDDYLFAVAQQRLERRGDRNSFPVIEFSNHLSATPFQELTMKKIFLITIIFPLAFTACGQTNDKNSQTIKTENKMDISKISNEHARKAIEALQANDKNAWYSYFTDDAVFTDDGRTLDLKSFFDNAFDKKEKFLSIDKVENDGKDIYGNFYAGQWGTFRVFFKFHINADGKINRLDIGQAR